MSVQCADTFCPLPVHGCGGGSIDVLPARSRQRVLYEGGGIICMTDNQGVKWYKIEALMPWQDNPNQGDRVAPMWMLPGFNSRFNDFTIP